MKKYLLMLPILALALMGCNRTEVIEKYVSPNYSVDYRIESWDYTDMIAPDGTPYASNYFYKEVAFPELTPDILLNGNVQVYRVLRDKQGQEYLQAIPYSTHREEMLQDGSWNYYTETISCAFGAGWMEFNVTHSDFFYEDDTTYWPEQMLFRVVITR